MNRQEFCTALSNAREKVKCGKNELCRKAGFNFNQLQRLETAYNNFKMELAFRYLLAINYTLVIRGRGKCVEIASYDDLFDWFLRKRKEKNWTVATIAEITGFSPGSISNVDNKRQVITIDLCLAFCEAYNCNVSIKPIEQCQSQA